MAVLAQIWRHPIKSHGAEALEAVQLIAGKTMPWDRHWAIAHEAAKADNTAWSSCANFSRGAKAPRLMAVSAQMDEAAGRVTLRHPDLGELTVDPDTEAEALIAWAAPLVPADRAQSARVVRVPDRGMTDTDFPSISLNSTSSLRALSQKVGTDLDQRRFRGNLWLDGLGPWEEFEWIGQTLRIGSAELRVVERIGRCLATTANPVTGLRDADTLGALKNGWDHTDFGVYAEVIKSGEIRLNDPVEVV
ncbi:MAG: MOSC domain-containing protein [Pseudomonadota bacterium]